MNSGHDKAPVRKKEDRKEGTEGGNKFHGPKTGVRGAHNLAHRDAGGWKCTRCSKYTATRLGWRRLVRGRCIMRAKASR
eukprot:14047966-Heterocapsa_arctica.AAC.1